jgi:hypothetical protein
MRKDAIFAGPALQTGHTQAQPTAELVRGTTASDHTWARKRWLLGPLCCPSLPPVAAAEQRSPRPATQATAGALRALCSPFAFALRAEPRQLRSSCGAAFDTSGTLAVEATLLLCADRRNVPPTGCRRRSQHQQALPSRTCQPGSASARSPQPRGRRSRRSSARRSACLPAPGVCSHLWPSAS